MPDQPGKSTGTATALTLKKITCKKNRKRWTDLKVLTALTLAGSIWIRDAPISIFGPDHWLPNTNHDPPIANHCRSQNGRERQSLIPIIYNLDRQQATVSLPIDNFFPLWIPNDWNVLLNFFTTASAECYCHIRYWNVSVRILLYKRHWKVPKCILLYIRW